MRAFVGVPLDPAHRQALTLGCEALRREDPRWRHEKWVPIDNLHITLRFLGELSPESIDSLTAELTSQLRAIPPAHVIFGSLRARPHASRARMAWAEFIDQDGGMAAIARSVSDVAASFGVPAEDRAYIPHVTLVRARRAHPVHSSALDVATAATRSALGQDRVMSVPHARLYKSTLTRAGASYEDLAEIPIGEPR